MSYHTRTKTCRCIVKVGVASSIHQSATLNGEDTDLLVLLFHYAYVDKELYFCSYNASRKKGAYNIHQLKIIFSQEVCSHLLSLHAFTGCDSTFRIFSIRKKSTFQKLLKRNPILKSCTSSFILPRQSKDVVADQSAMTMAALFGVNCGDFLAEMQYHVFVNKFVFAKSFKTPERIPQTVSSKKFHSLRTYYQIVV